MGDVQLRQVRTHLETHYAPHIDVADYDTKPLAEKKNALLTRSLAAFAIANLADINVEIACSMVVDGYNDNGIDAIYYGDREKTLYLCQSKWSNDRTGSLDLAGAEKFIRGVRDIIRLKFDNFNGKICSRQLELTEAIFGATKVVLSVITSGAGKMGVHSERALNDFLTEINDTGEVMSLSVFNQEQVYRTVSQGGQGSPIDLRIQIFDWGQAKNPFQAFYGQIAASDLAFWGRSFGYRLFSKNIRSFLGSQTSVNQGIATTMRDAPSHFWYMNNGVTILCSSISKMAIGGNSRDVGNFACSGVAVVNGAQTVGAITELERHCPDQIQIARVPIRLISLEGCPPGFENEVTRATNTQNRIDARNFVALDSEQSRIRSELLIDGIEYEFRQGEAEPSGDKRFGLVEATLALVCSQGSLDTVVQSKRDINRIWEDIEAYPYTNLFHSKLSGLKLWHLVQIFRVIESRLSVSRSFSKDSRVRNTAVYGNRLVCHLVFHSLGIMSLGKSSFIVHDYSEAIYKRAGEVEAAVADVACKLFADAYMAYIFKNVSKCKEIMGKISMHP